MSELADDVAVMYAGKIVESGPATSLFDDPRHPYTRALLACEIDPDEAPGTPLVTIKGGLPDLVDVPAGCIFAERCPLRFDKCRGRAAIGGGRAGPFRRMLARMRADSRQVLETSGLHVTFAGGVQAVAGVDLGLAAGETVGLVGESGSGKTTLAKALVGLNRPSAGTVRLDGRDLTALTRADRLWLRRRVQMIFQDPLSSLSPRMRIRKLLAEPLAIHGLDAQHHWPHVQEVTKRLGLAETLLDKYPHQISGGQARRVAIARALATQPTFLIADEPTAGLDVSVQGDLLNLLADLQRQFALGILIVSHNLNVVGRITDRVAILYLGKVMEEGSTRRIFQRAAASLHVRPAVGQSGDRSRTAGEPRCCSAGEIPSPRNPPSGCRFHTRCPRAQDRCRVEEPQLAGDAEQRYACHFPLESAA